MLKIESKARVIKEREESHLMFIVFLPGCFVFGEKCSFEKYGKARSRDSLKNLFETIFVA